VELCLGPKLRRPNKIRNHPNGKPQKKSTRIYELKSKKKKYNIKQQLSSK